MADLAAPSVVEACLSRTTHAISAAGTEFVVSGTDAPRTATLRELFGDLAPVAVLRGEHSEHPGEVVACPGRDVLVHEGDWTAMIGTADELRAQGIAVAPPMKAPTEVGHRGSRGYNPIAANRSSAPSTPSARSATTSTPTSSRRSPRP